MSDERPSKLAALIARMPKDIRAEVERLDAQVLDLQLKLNMRLAALSPVNYMDTDYEAKGGCKSLHMPIPVDKPVRFYNRFKKPTENNRGNYIEVYHERRVDKGETRLILEVRADLGQLTVVPQASNTIYLIGREDYRK